MARADRRLGAGSIHHVHNRGALRRTLFVEPADWRLFLGARTMRGRGMKWTCSPGA